MEISDYEKGKQIADDLVKEFSPKVLGQKLPGWQCDCGALHHSEAEAVNIHVPGLDKWPYQIALWYLWSVNMMDIDGRGYSVGLSEFVPSEKLEPLFAERFAGLDLSED